MSPSEKFVQTSSDYISKNNWVKTVLAEKDQTGGRGGPREFWQKTIILPIFFLHPMTRMTDRNIIFDIL